MTKHLRFFMLALLAVVFGTAWGGTITFADLGLENGVQYSDPFDGGDFTVTFSGGANDGKYYNTGQGIRVYGGGTMTVAAKSGNLTKIVITFAEGYKPESADVADTGSYDVESGIWTGTSASVSFTRPSGSGHWRVQAVEATVQGGTSVEKTTPTMSFNPASLTITKGESFTEPTLSYDGDGAITYSIDNDNVATINANSGKLTVTGIGKATVTATAAETDNYKRGTASYALTVNPGETPDDDGDAIVFGELGLENGVQYTDPFDGGSFTVTFAGGANDGKYYNTGQGIRVYGGGTMTVAAKEGNLTKVTVTFADGGYRPESADVVDNGSFDPGTGVWTGQVPSVTFTRPTGSGHWRVQKVAAVINGSSTPATLKINGTTPFIGSTQVTITPSNPDFAIYYTTDGSDPRTNPTVYSGPFTITETTTVKAVEEDLEGNMSAVVEKTFVKEDLNIQTVANIAAFKALEDGVEANLTLSDAQVLYAGSADIYVRDASGAIDFYNTGLKLTTGQILNGSVVGKRATYNNIPELVKSDNTNSNAITATAGTATPIVLTVPQAKDEQYYCNLIRIEGVKVVAKQEGTYTNYYAYVGNDSIMVYDRFKVGLGDWNENDTYNLEGILVPYKGAFEVYLTQPLAGGSTPPDPGVPVCDNIAAFKALSSGTEAQLKLDNAQVLYALDRDVYVRDASGAIEFYNLGINFETNQKLNGSIIGKYSPYNNLPEMAKTDKTNADNITFSSGSAAQPIALTLAQAQDMKYVCELVSFDNVDVVEADGAFSLSDGQSTLALFNKFKIELAAATGTKVTGILVIFKEAYQLYPISIGGGDTPPDPGVPVCDNIAAFKALESGTEAQLKLDNAQVLYAKDRDVYVRDASGAIEFYNLGITFENDQVLNGSIIGKFSPYNNLPEIAKTDKTNADNITFSAGSPAQPIALTLAQAQDMKYVCELVTFDNVNVVEADGNFSLSDGQSTLALFNKFKIDLVAVNQVKATGILVIFKEAYQLYPITIDVNQGIDQLVSDDMTDAPAYNLAGQRVDASYKGVVIQNGRKLLRK